MAAYTAAQSNRFSASAPLPTTPPARGGDYSARNQTLPASLQQQLFGPSPASANAHLNIVDRPLAKTRGAEVAVGAWAFLFAEIVAYSQSRVDSVSDLEARCVGGLGVLGSALELADTGYQVIVIRLRCRPEDPPAVTAAQYPSIRHQSMQKRTPPYSYTPIHPHAGVPLLFRQGRGRSRTQRRGRR